MNPGADACVESLRKVLAETYLLLVKTHGYHWNVVGPHFNSLHLMFEAQYTELFAAVDEIAERIRALCAKAPGSFSAFAALAEAEEGQPNSPAFEMVASLLKDHERLSGLCRIGITHAEDARDAATADLLTVRQGVHEKTAWMLRVYLQ